MKISPVTLFCLVTIVAGMVACSSEDPPSQESDAGECWCVVGEEKCDNAVDSGTCYPIFPHAVREGGSGD